MAICACAKHENCTVQPRRVREAPEQYLPTQNVLMAAVCVHHYHSEGETSTQTYTEGYYYQGTAVMVNNQFSTLYVS